MFKYHLKFFSIAYLPLTKLLHGQSEFDSANPSFKRALASNLTQWFKKLRHAWCKNQDEIFSSLRRYHTIQNNNSKILYVFIWQTNEDISKIAFYSQLCLASLSEKVYMLEYLKEPVIPTLANGSFCRNTCRLISPFLL